MFVQKEWLRRAHLVVFHWVHKGWSHFGPLFRPGFFIFHWFYNRIWLKWDTFSKNEPLTLVLQQNLQIPSLFLTRNHVWDRFYKGLVKILTVYSILFDQVSAFPLVLQQNRQIRSNAFFVFFDAILDHFGTEAHISGPDSLQRPSLRLWPPELKGNFHQREISSNWAAELRAPIWEFN